MSIRKRRFIYGCLIIISSFVIPIAVTIHRFNMIARFRAMPTKVKNSILGILVIILLVIIMFKKIKKMLNDMEFSLFKVIIFSTIKLFTLIFGLTILIGLSIVIDDLVYVFSWVVGCNIPSLFIFEPLWQKANYQVKRSITVDIIKEGVKG